VGAARAAVDFLGIGAQKAGTSWLASNLSRHPQVFVPPVKEVHFWNAHLHRGWDWYLGQFGDAEPAQARGEITPAYAVLPAEVVEQVAAALPDVRLMYLLRDPVERAWSAALMALGRAQMTIDEASDQWFIDHFRSRASLTRGDYESCLRTWLRSFPREQLLVELFDDVVSRPVDVLERCARHLGVRRGEFAARPDLAGERVFSGPGHPLRPVLREFLVERYAPAVESLEHFLDRDLRAWCSDAQR
jgi:hypothetical protein